MNAPHTQRRHRAWRLPDDVDTDQLAPGATMKFGIDVIARHCLQAVRPEFASSVQPGDVVVAGRNFGIGSSREQAAQALVQLGVAAVIAQSFGGLFFRNAVNVGLLPIVCAHADRIDDGERITFDAAAGRIERECGETLGCEPLPEFMLELISDGGLPQLRRRFAQRAAAPPADRPDAARSPAPDRGAAADSEENQR
jgi:3-isopropylmalate/(R)-2-methylmalate dehydratase small subunit